MINVYIITMFGNNAHTGRLNVRDHVAMVQWPRLTPQSSIEDFQKVMHGRWTKMAMDGYSGHESKPE